MKYLICFLIVFTFIGTVQAQFMKDLSRPLKEIGNGVLLIDDFEDDPVGMLPGGWYNRDVKRRADNPEESLLFHYTIEEENHNKYLHFEHTDARHLNLPLADRPNLNIYTTPILSWKWRVHKIPENGNELEKNANDAAASIYVVFDVGRVAFVKKVPKSIRYTWSSNLEKGSEHSVFFGNQKIIVLESGEEHVGSGWRSIHRNILEDYRRLFKSDPPKTPLAILILSDGDSLNEEAIADYDDLMFMPLYFLDKAQ